MPRSDPALTATADPGASGDCLTVYFDGSCPLCTAEINFYASRKGSDVLHLVDVSAETADTGPDLERNAAMRRFHVRRSDGSLLSGGAAFVAIWEALPGWSVAGRLARRRPVTAVLEAGYRLFLPVRPTLSRATRWITR